MQPLSRTSKFLLLFLPIWLLFSSWIRYLAVPDEGRYGDISRYMFISGDWLIPRINGLPFMHKPPLLHWLSAGLMEVFGVHPWVVRLVPVLAGCLMLGSLFFFLKKHVSEYLAQLTVMVLSTSLLFYGSSEYVNHDLLVAAWITVCILSVVDFTFSAKKTMLFLGYFAAAAAFLSKGLIGILIPGMVLLPWILYTNQWKKIPSLLNPIAIIFFLLLTAPWIYLVQLKYPQFLYYFFIDQQFNRFNSNEFNNKQPFIFYPAILFLSFLPWLLVSRFQFKYNILKETLSQPIIVLCLWWFISVTIFFSIPPSKLAGYILPAVPPLAILIATAVQSILKKSQKTVLQIYGFAIFSLIIGLSIGLSPILIKNNHAFYLEHAIFLYGIGTTLCLIPFIMIFLYKKSKLSYLHAVFFSLIVLCSAIPIATRYLDAKNNAGQTSFEAYITPKSTIIFYHKYFYDLPFLLNLKNPVYVVDHWNEVKTDNASLELKDGLLFEPKRQKYLIDTQQLQKMIDTQQQIILISDVGEYQNKVTAYPSLHYRNFDVFFINGSIKNLK